MSGVDQGCRACPHVAGGHDAAAWAYCITTFRLSEDGRDVSSRTCACPGAADRAAWAAGSTEVQAAVVSSTAAWTAALQDEGFDGDGIERVRKVATRSLLTGLTPHEQRQEDARAVVGFPIVADPSMPADQVRLVDARGQVLAQFTISR